jgi:hypothetical protein
LRLNSKSFTCVTANNAEKSRAPLLRQTFRLRPAEVKWLSGAEYVKRFDYPGDRLFTKVFCSECGSGLPFLNKSGKKLFIPAGSLDSAPGILPGHKSSGGSILLV